MDFAVMFLQLKPGRIIVGESHEEDSRVGNGVGRCVFDIRIG
jgi:hypothetical protein